MVVWWKAAVVAGLTGYRLEVRQFPQPWSSAKVGPVPFRLIRCVVLSVLAMFLPFLWLDKPLSNVLENRRVHDVIK